MPQQQACGCMAHVLHMCAGPAPNPSTPRSRTSRSWSILSDRSVADGPVPAKATPMCGLKLYRSPLISSGFFKPLSRMGPGMNWPGRMVCSSRGECSRRGVVRCPVCRGYQHLWQAMLRHRLANLQLPRGDSWMQEWAHGAAAGPMQAHLDLVLAKLAIQQPPGDQCCLASLRVCI